MCWIMGKRRSSRLPPGRRKKGKKRKLKAEGTDGRQKKGEGAICQIKELEGGVESGRPNVPVGHQCRDERAGEREIERVEKTEREMGRRGHREGEREGSGREKESLEVGDEQSGRFFWNLISWIGYHETGMLSKKKVLNCFHILLIGMYIVSESFHWKYENMEINFKPNKFHC